MILNKPLLTIQLFSVYCITSGRYFYLTFTTGLRSSECIPLAAPAQGEEHLQSIIAAIERKWIVQKAKLGRNMQIRKDNLAIAQQNL